MSAGSPSCTKTVPFSSSSTTKVSISHMGTVRKYSSNCFLLSSSISFKNGRIFARYLFSIPSHLPFSFGTAAHEKPALSDYLFPFDIFCFHPGIPVQIDQSLQPFPDGKRTGVPDLAVVDHNRDKLVPFF